MTVLHYRLLPKIVVATTLIMQLAEVAG